MKLESSVYVPLGVIKPFLSKMNEIDLMEYSVGIDEGDEDEDHTEFLLIDLEYPDLDCQKDIRWKEMSYNRLKDTSTTWVYDFYSNGEW